MSLVVNNNMMAANTARNLNAHYGRLATSTQRLSSGLRINSAADDAAGLAIRELQRADIAALHQGARNANDAISMIQVADGSLGIIDEKLIRMKELAEQAATGTYDSTQRLMIESEYQAMASEITRIANATDFNGTKLLDGTLSGEHDGSGMVSEGKLKVHFGTGNDSAEDYYYIEIGECTSQAFGLGNASTWQDVQNRGVEAFRQSLEQQIKASGLTSAEKGELLAQIDTNADALQKALENATDYKEAFKLWSNDGVSGFMKEGMNWVGNSDLMERYLAAANATANAGGPTIDTEIEAAITTAIANVIPQDSIAATPPTTSDFAKVWTLVESAAKQAASDAGFNAEEIQSLLYDKDSGLQSVWNTTIKNATTPLKYQDLQTELKNAVDGYLRAASTEMETVGTALTNGQVIASRNEAYKQYAAGKPIAEAGPTTAEGVINGLQAALDTVWAQASAKAFSGTTPASLETQVDAFNQALADMKVAVTKLGLTNEEADQIIGMTALAIATNGTNGDPVEGLDDIGKKIEIADTKDKLAVVKDADQNITSEEWDAIKDTLTWAIGSLTEYTPEQAAQYGGGTIKKKENGVYVGKDIENGSFADHVAIRNQGAAAAKADDKLEEFWNGLRDTEKQKLQYAWGQAAIYNLANAAEGRIPNEYGIGATGLDFGSTLTSQGSKDVAQTMLSQAMDAMHEKVGHMDFAGHTIETQEDAQHALDAINEAIVSKDKIRAHLGATQNRLENTVSNLNIQAENLQAAESRISDVDVATEMTQFVRNQILTQSAVAMLSQANSLPQMAMQLIGG